MARRSFPARWPVFKLDRVWVKPMQSLLEVNAYRSDAARQASDHLPVVASVRLGQL